LQKAVAQTYTRLLHQKNIQAANLYLLELSEQFSPQIARLALDNNHLKNFAATKAYACVRVCFAKKSEQLAYEHIKSRTLCFGVEAPIIQKQITLTGALKRLSDEKWWRANLYRSCMRQFESTSIRCGLTHSKAGLYISDASFKAVQSKRIRNEELLKSLIAVNELGHEFTLANLASLSVSNPVNRRNELMARLHGFDVTAKKLNHAGIFSTITCPSRMHARFKKSGDPNPSYENYDPRMSQAYLCRLWSQIRTALSHLNIQIYGFRVAEPQHDGTPHWHLLIYSAPENVSQIKQIISSYALNDSPNEPGASKIRSTHLDIDWSKGTGVGYIAKYISKNVDGMHVEKDLMGNDAASTAKRVSAWASIQGIRQFQQLGGPTVTSWRELRRINEAPEGILNNAREAADAGNWQLFTEILGGVDCPRKDQKIKLAWSYSDEIGMYAEPKGDSIFGVTDGLNVLVTRIHTWTINRSTKKPSIPSAAG